MTTSHSKEEILKWIIILNHENKKLSRIIELYDYDLAEKYFESLASALIKDDTLGNYDISLSNTHRVLFKLEKSL